MPRTANVLARVEPEIKQKAEEIFEQLGISTSNAVGMFLRQVVLQRGIPFEVKLPEEKPLAYGALTKAQLNSIISEGIESLEKGDSYSVEEIEAEMARDFGV